MDVRARAIRLGELQRVEHASGALTERAIGIAANRRQVARPHNRAGHIKKLGVGVIDSVALFRPSHGRFLFLRASFPDL